MRRTRKTVGVVLGCFVRSRGGSMGYWFFKGKIL